MTAAELKTYIADQLTAPVNQVSKLIAVLDQMVDYSSAVNTDIIPDWTSLLTFQTDGTDAGQYCKYPDSDGKIRIFETLVDDNLNNAPPNNPLVTSNTYWEEISSSAGSSIHEWSAGLFVSGLIIVYHDHSVDGKGLYLLVEATRPFSSANIEAEIITGKWIRITRKEPIYVDVSTASGTITLDFGNETERRYKGSANITAARAWALDNDDNAVLIPSILFQTNAGVVHTFPAEFKMSNALWDSSAKTWTPLDAGRYEGSACFDGTNWWLKIEGPYN